MFVEPLKDKIHIINVSIDGLEPDKILNFLSAKLFFYDNIKSAVGFYKKYRYHLDLLKEKEPEAFKEWCNSREYAYFKRELKNGNSLLAEEYYRDWLFDYSFQDVIE